MVEFLKHSSVCSTALLQENASKGDGSGGSEIGNRHDYFVHYGQGGFVVGMYFYSWCERKVCDGSPLAAGYVNNVLSFEVGGWGLWKKGLDARLSRAGAVFCVMSSDALN